jgi:hypothetical protein
VIILSEFRSVLWIRISKDPKIFAGSGTGPGTQDYGYGERWEAGISPVSEQPDVADHAQDGSLHNVPEGATESSGGIKQGIKQAPDPAPDSKLDLNKNNHPKN